MKATYVSGLEWRQSLLHYIAARLQVLALQTVG